MSTTGATADPLAALGALPGVADVRGVRAQGRGPGLRAPGHAAPQQRGHLRGGAARRARLRGARPVPTGPSKRCAGAPTSVATTRPRTVGAALRLTAEAGQLLSIWRQSPLRVLARLHLVAAGGARDDDGRAAAAGGRAGRRAARSSCRCRAPTRWPAGWRACRELIIAGSSAPALVTAAVVHGELLALRPFGSHNGLVARAAERIVLVGSGLDPKSVCPAEVGHAELGRAAYVAALDGYVSGTPEGMAAWIAHCGGRSNWARGSRRRCARRCSAARP